VNFLSLIEQKREGKIIAPGQIQEFIREFTAGGNSRLPDGLKILLLISPRLCGLIK